VKQDSLLDQAAELVMAAIVAVWATRFGMLALHRFFNINIGVFDLGIFDQGLWLLSRFEDPFITLRGLHLFADHASYILILMAPIYWVFPSTTVLVVLGAVVPAVAGWLSFRIARVEGLGPWAAVAVGATVLLMPAMAWTPWDSFHPEIFAIALLPASYLAARRGRFTLALALAAAILLLKEDSGLVVVPYALFIWLRWKEARKHAYLLAGLAVAVQALSLLVVLPGLSPTGELIYSGRYDLDWERLATWSRAAYIPSMVLPGVLALWAPRFLLVGLPITVANLLSTHTYQHDIKWHYTAYLLGVLAVAVPLGTARLRSRILGPDSRWSFPGGGNGIVAVGLLAAVVGMAALGPDLNTRGGWWGGLSEQQHAELAVLLEAVPPDAVVAASWNLASRLTHRRHIYMLPNPYQPRFWGAEGLPPSHDPATIEYFAWDKRHGRDEIGQLPEELIEAGWTIEVDGTFQLLRNPAPSGTPGSPAP
jgi:uncharacterized membrane protein